MQLLIWLPLETYTPDMGNMLTKKNLQKENILFDAFIYI
jgi:hypothetical protein